VIFSFFDPAEETFLKLTKLGKQQRKDLCGANLLATTRHIRLNLDSLRYFGDPAPSLTFMCYFFNELTLDFTGAVKVENLAESLDFLLRTFHDAAGKQMSPDQDQTDECFRRVIHVKLNWSLVQTNSVIDTFMAVLTSIPHRRRLKVLTTLRADVSYYAQNLPLKLFDMSDELSLNEAKWNLTLPKTNSMFTSTVRLYRSELMIYTVNSKSDSYDSCNTFVHPLKRLEMEDSALVCKEDPGFLELRYKVTGPKSSILEDKIKNFFTRNCSAQRNVQLVHFEFADDEVKPARGSAEVEKEMVSFSEHYFKECIVPRIYDTFFKLAEQTNGATWNFVAVQLIDFIKAVVRDINLTGCRLSKCELLCTASRR
jgi:hypothetical protein